MAILEDIAFAAVFAGVVLAGELIRRTRGLREDTATAMTREHVPSTPAHAPPVDVILEYQNAAGRKLRRRPVTVLGYMPRSRGRSCFLALCDAAGTPRTFRVDRVVHMTSPSGEILDADRFLREHFGSGGHPVHH